MSENSPIATLITPDLNEQFRIGTFINYRRKKSDWDTLRWFNRHQTILDQIAPARWRPSNRKFQWSDIFNWQTFLTAHADDPIDFHGTHTTLGNLAAWVSNFYVRCFYDWEIAIKSPDTDPETHIPKLDGIITAEFLDLTLNHYIFSKEWSAEQYLKDYMPMIYIVKSPAEKRYYLERTAIIGHIFPILTKQEYLVLMAGMHAAYADMGPQFSFERFIQRLFITEMGNSRPNWLRWGMNNPTHSSTALLAPDHTAKMIQGTFGYKQARSESEIGFLNSNFIWTGGRGQIFTYNFENMNWISSFWLIYRQSITIRRKAYAQWQIWMPPFQKPQYENY